MNKEERYREAVDRVRSLRNFYIHLSVYVVINAIFLIAMFATDGQVWSIWATVGWGIGLASHASWVWLRASKLARQWEERKIKELMSR